MDTLYVHVMLLTLYLGREAGKGSSIMEWCSVAGIYIVMWVNMGMYNPQLVCDCGEKNMLIQGGVCNGRYML